ncbi:hypothetical protein BH11ARM1_BH11ARM1_07850 [soil metagenome]
MRLVSAFLVLLIAACSFASNVGSNGGTLIVNEVSVLTLRATISGSGPAARAKILAAKLNGQASLDLQLVSSKSATKLYGNGDLLIMISKAEGNAHGTSPKALGAAWLIALRNAWNLPPLKLSKTTVLLPIGGSATITAVGSDARTASWSTENPDVVSVVRTGANLKFFANQVGDTTVTVGSADSPQTVTVRVMPYAAKFPQSFTATVVGDPASASTVKGAIDGILNTRLQSAPDAKVSWATVTVPSVGPGERKSLTVRVEASSPNSFPATGVVNITVSNIAISLRKENELWYCNEPENIQRPQALFSGTLKADDPVRMLYHHINDSPQGLFFRILIQNTSSLPASLILIPGDSKDRNPVLAGIMAADPFFRSWLTGSAEVVSIPPGTAIPLAFRRLAPQETSSGLCYLRLLPGGAKQLSISAEAVNPFELDTKWQAAQRTPTPWREVAPSQSLTPTYLTSDSDLIYPQPFKNEEFGYKAGGNFGFFRIGQIPIKRRDPGKALDGNFGVIYNITGRAENPTQFPADIELVFETSAGYSGGLFQIDGEVVRLPLMASKAEVRLKRFRLEPGDSKSISITTIPLSGSSYPATLVLRPVSSMPDLIVKPKK